MDHTSQKEKPCHGAGLGGGWLHKLVKQVGPRSASRRGVCPVCLHSGQEKKWNLQKQGGHGWPLEWPEEGPENQTGALLLLEAGIRFSFWNRHVPQ